MEFDTTKVAREESQKKPYNAPGLVVLDTVADLTAGDTGSGSESFAFADAS